MRNYGRLIRIYWVVLTKRQSSLNSFIKLVRFFQRRSWFFCWRNSMFSSVIISTFSLSFNRRSHFPDFLILKNRSSWSNQRIIFEQSRIVLLIEINRHRRRQLGWVLHKTRKIVLLFTTRVYFDNKRILCLYFCMNESRFFEFGNVRSWN